MELTVIIPVLNEEKTIAEVIQQVRDTGLVNEIMVVDDGSTDGTQEILRQYENDPLVTLIFSPKNEGKGAAVRKGINAARSRYAIIQDADLEYDPKFYRVLMEPILEGKADIVYGSRFLGAARRPILFWNMVANKILTFMTNILYNNILSDMETGYKMFEVDLIRQIPLHAKGFDFEPEFTAKVLKRNYRIYEVPIEFTPRYYSEGKKIKAKDGFIAFWTLIKYRFVD